MKNELKKVKSWIEVNRIFWNKLELIGSLCLDLFLNYE